VCSALTRQSALVNRTSGDVYSACTDTHLAGCDSVHWTDADIHASRFAVKYDAVAAGRILEAEPTDHRLAF
jgi:hypothetical protein